jgi:hypothetical protein
MASASAIRSQNSSASIKLSNSNINIRVIATKLMKQFGSEKTFTKEEALKFVHAVLRQTKDGNGNGLLGFDAAY